MLIEVFGAGCARCQLTAQNLRGVVKELGLGDKIQVVEIHDINQMASRGVLITPAVFIDGVKVWQGKVPSPKEIKSWLAGKA